LDRLGWEAGIAGAGSGGNVRSIPDPAHGRARAPSRPAVSRTGLLVSCRNPSEVRTRFGATIRRRYY
jgi:hypothetical protein